MPCRLNFPCHTLFPRDSRAQHLPGCSWLSRKSWDLVSCFVLLSGYTCFWMRCSTHASECDQGASISSGHCWGGSEMGEPRGLWEESGAAEEWRWRKAVGVRGADSYLEEFNIYISCGNCIQMRGSVDPSLQQLIKLSRKTETVPVTPPTVYKPGLCNSK